MYCFKSLAQKLMNPRLRLPTCRLRIYLITFLHSQTNHPLIILCNMNTALVYSILIFRDYINRRANQYLRSTIFRASIFCRNPPGFSSDLLQLQMDAESLSNYGQPLYCRKGSCGDAVASTLACMAR